jgi:hypothetical protein
MLQQQKLVATGVSLITQAQQGKVNLFMMYSYVPDENLMTKMTPYS